jgi:hypothetical protein
MDRRTIIAISLAAAFAATYRAFFEPIALFGDHQPRIEKEDCDLNGDGQYSNLEVRLCVDNIKPGPVRP